MVTQGRKIDNFLKILSKLQKYSRIIQRLSKVTLEVGLARKYENLMMYDSLKFD